MMQLICWAPLDILLFPVTYFIFSGGVWALAMDFKSAESQFLISLRSSCMQDLYIEAADDRGNISGIL